MNIGGQRSIVMRVTKSVVSKASDRSRKVPLARATLSDLVASIDSSRSQGNLSSAIRLFVLDHFRSGSADTSSSMKPTHANL